MSPTVSSEWKGPAPPSWELSELPAWGATQAQAGALGVRGNAGIPWPGRSQWPWNSEWEFYHCVWNTIQFVKATEQRILFGAKKRQVLLGGNQAPAEGESQARPWLQGCQQAWLGFSHKAVWHVAGAVTPMYTARVLTVPSSCALPSILTLWG